MEEIMDKKLLEGSHVQQNAWTLAYMSVCLPCEYQ